MDIHSETCHHDFELIKTTHVIGTYEYRDYYVCKLCGKEKCKITFAEEELDDWDWQIKIKF